MRLYDLPRQRRRDRQAGQLPGAARGPGPSAAGRGTAASAPVVTVGALRIDTVTREVRVGEATGSSSPRWSTRCCATSRPTRGACSPSSGAAARRVGLSRRRAHPHTRRARVPAAPQAQRPRPRAVRRERVGRRLPARAGPTRAKRPEPRHDRARTRSASPASTGRGCWPSPAGGRAAAPTPRTRSRRRSRPRSRAGNGSAARRRSKTTSAVTARHTALQERQRGRPHTLARRAGSRPGEPTRADRPIRARPTWMGGSTPSPACVRSSRTRRARWRRGCSASSYREIAATFRVELHQDQPLRDRRPRGDARLARRRQPRNAGRVRRSRRRTRRRATTGTRHETAHPCGAEESR